MEPEYARQTITRSDSTGFRSLAISGAVWLAALLRSQRTRGLLRNHPYNDGTGLREAVEGSKGDAVIVQVIVKCRKCGFRGMYQAEKYHAVEAAVARDYREWDRKAGTGECRRHQEDVCTKQS
jgi:hypothetical protein